MLIKIFDLQDSVFKYNLKDGRFVEKVIFINDCFTLVNSITFKDKEDFKLVHILLNDVCTGIVSSLRLGLYGCVSDAAAISRVALEHLAILDYVTDNCKYQILRAGLKRGYQKVKINYDSITKYLDPVVIQLHGRLSDLFSHSTKNRILYSGIHEKGKDCIGASIDKKKINELLNHLCNLILFAVRITQNFLEKNKINDGEFSKRHAELEIIYLNLK